MTSSHITHQLALSRVSELHKEAAADRLANEVAHEFQRLRPHLLRVADSRLGSVGNAEDLVQEAWIRLAGSERSTIRDLRSWLTTVVGRLALDVLTSPRARRELSVGACPPDAVVPVGAEASDTALRVEAGESISTALQIVCESLSPAERSAFILHDVFDYSFAEVARVVGRSPQASRQLAVRARRAISARASRYPASGDEQGEVVNAFLGATENGDLTRLLELLDPTLTPRSDGLRLVSGDRRFQRTPRPQSPSEPQARPRPNDPVATADRCRPRSGAWRLYGRPVLRSSPPCPWSPRRSPTLPVDSEHAAV